MPSTFIAPTRKLAPRSVFALNREPIMSRIEAGILASDVFKELSEFLTASKHEPPSASSFYEFLKIQVRKGEKKPLTARPDSPTPTPAFRPASPPGTVFDPDKKFSDDELV